jgi:hypothetical protein
MGRGQGQVTAAEHLRLVRDPDAPLIDARPGAVNDRDRELADAARGLHRIDDMSPEEMLVLRERFNDLSDWFGLKRCWQIVEPAVPAGSRQIAYMLTETQAMGLDADFYGEPMNAEQLGHKLAELLPEVQATYG